MPIQRQRWAPDTCGCELEQELDVPDTLRSDTAATETGGILSLTERVPSGTVTQTFRQWHHVCEAHESHTGTLAQLYTTVLAENQAKNTAYGAALTAAQAAYKTALLNEFGEASGSFTWKPASPFRWDFDETRRLRWNVRTLATNDRTALVNAVTAATTYLHTYDVDATWDVTSRWRPVVRQMWRRILDGVPTITTQIVDPGTGRVIGRRFLPGAKPTFSINVAQRKVDFDFSALGATDRAAVIAAIAPLFPGSSL